MVDARDVKELLDACYLARRVVDCLPALPSKLTRSHVKVLDAIYTLREKGSAAGVRVSDVATALKTTRPSVTRIVSELEVRGDVYKCPDASDGRVVLVHLTAQGVETHHAWVDEVHGHIASLLADAGVSEGDVATAVRVLAQVHEVMTSADLQGWQTLRLKDVTAG